MSFFLVQVLGKVVKDGNVDGKEWEKGKKFKTISSVSLMVVDLYVHWVNFLNVSVKLS